MVSLCEDKDLTMCQHMSDLYLGGELKCWTFGEQSRSLIDHMLALLTWLQWVLNIEHGRPVAIHHVLLNLVFGNVAASVLYPDTCFQVVEVATVELKELNEQNTDVDVWTAHILPVMKLEMTMYERMSDLFQMVK